MTGVARARESQNNYNVRYCKSSDVAYKEVLNNKAKLYNLYTKKYTLNNREGFEVISQVCVQFSECYL